MSGTYSPDTRATVEITPAPKPAGDLSPAAIRSWLTLELAELLSIAPEEIKPDEPFANYGLSSMTGVLLAGDIEDWLGLKIDSVAAWDYPTVEAMTRYLTGELARDAVAA